MKSLLQIIQRVAAQPEKEWALATLVRTGGSTYRKPGARLLVDDEGSTTGVLSGGCLEEEIGQRGVEVMQCGKARLVSFDTQKQYGCDGRLDVLIERLPPAGSGGNLITRLGQCLTQRERCCLRTVYESDECGTDMLPPGRLLAEREGVFLHAVPLPVRLLLFGTGPEIEPVTRLAGTLGWKVNQVVHPAELQTGFAGDDQTAAIVMTHHFGRDLAALAALVPLNLPYIGLLGPRRRHGELIARLHDFNPPEAQWLDRIFAPAGLDTGSEAPEEIALSIVSEVAAILAGRTGGCLRDRRENIHQQAALFERSA